MHENSASRARPPAERSSFSVDFFDNEGEFVTKRPQSVRHGLPSLEDAKFAVRESIRRLRAYYAGIIYNPDGKPIAMLVRDGELQEL